MKELGFLGLYKGARACLLRDVPFSAIYFPAYAHMKQYTADENGHCGPASLFISAFTAGVPAAALVTPADVIKTRLQVQGSIKRYNGWLDAFQKIWSNEGTKGFFRGSTARVIWYVPASAFTFMAVEFLRENFNHKMQPDAHEVASLSMETNTPMTEVVFELNGKKSYP